MEKSKTQITTCQNIRALIKKCKKPCPLLQLYAQKCDTLCIRNDNLKECHNFTELMQLILPKKRIKK